MRNAVLDLHKDHLPPKTMSMISKCLKLSMSRTLSVLIIYKELNSIKYIVLASLTFSTYFNYVALDFLYVLHKKKDKFYANFSE